MVRQAHHERLKLPVRPELVEGHSVILLGALSYSLVRISDVEPHALSRTGSVMDGRLRIAVACFTALSCALCVSFAWAQNTSGYPTKPVRMVTASAGSQTDAMARIISAKLAEKWGQPVVVENRSGAGGAIGASIVAKAAPDGYTLLFQSPQFAVGAALNEKLPYDVLKDFAGIARVGNSTVVLITSPSFGVKSVKELIVFAKAQPKPVLFSSAGAGSSTHMNGERFKLTAGIAATHVGFKGAPEAVIEVAAGRVHYTVTALSVALPLLRDGKLTPLAMLSTQRSPSLPDVPIITEVFPGYGRDGAYCLLAPAGTPRPLLARISADAAQVLSLPDVKERLQKMEFDVAPTKLEDFDRLLRNDIETFRKVARQAGLIAK